jgi:hypothetical protein
MVNWKDIDINFTTELQKEWENKGFRYEECKDWIGIGLGVNDVEYAYWLKEIKKVDTDWVHNYGDDEQLREEYKDYWISRWHSKKFTDREMEAWKKVGLRPQDGGYAAWMRDIAKITPDEYPNHLNEGDDNSLRKQHQKFLKERKNKNKITELLILGWYNNGFVYDEVTAWIDAGLRNQDAGYAAWLRDVCKITLSEYSNLDEISNKLLWNQYQENWKINPEFDSESQTKWERWGFTAEETGKWINFANLRFSEAGFAYWLKKYKQINPESSFNSEESNENLKSLRKKYQEYLESENTIANVQEWLEERFLKEQKPYVTNLDISNKHLEGHLDLTDFTNLELLNCSDNNLTGINLGDSAKNLRLLVCSDNQLTSLDVSTCHNLELLKCCPGNRLTKLDLSNCPNLKQVIYPPYVDLIKPINFAEKNTESKIREIDKEGNELIKQENQFQTQILQTKFKSLEEELTRTQKQLKEISDIVLPNDVFEFSTLKSEIEKIKIENLNYQIRTKKTELGNLITNAKSKLGEESEFLLDILLEIQTVSTSTSKSLESLQSSLSKKLDREEIEIICQKQKEILQLEQERNNIQKETKDIVR